MAPLVAVQQCNVMVQCNSATLGGAEGHLAFQDAVVEHVEWSSIKVALFATIPV